jgi:hypothetical protein
MNPLDVVFHRPAQFGEHPDHHNDGPSMCCAVTRIAVSVAAVAIAVFATTVFLVSGDLVALGISGGAFIVGVCCLLPTRRIRPVFPHIHAPIIPQPSVFVHTPQRVAPFGWLFGGGHPGPESHVHVGDGRPAVPVQPMHHLGPEGRVPVGRRGG